jgi:hypothetical protein
LTQASTTVYVRLDDCDQNLEDYKKLNWPDNFIITIGPRIRLSGSMQEMFSRHPNEPWYGLLADDLILRTLHWDLALIKAAVPNKISYANSIHENENLICHPCVGGNLVRAVGFFGLPEVQHFGTDTVWEKIHHEFNMDGRLNDVIIEHAHFVYNQSSLDVTYKESQALKDIDKKRFRNWKKQNFNLLIEKIKNEFAW